tara:strand:- start:1056 stop:2426 length:1371 start_codon:yes stop_codon:yes gene_type:complete
MATLAEQLEDALRGQGTTIAPGTLSPVNVGTNQLSWSDTFDRIQQRKPLKPGEGLPTVPQGVPASTFYRQATQLGAMPSGASQFFVKPLAPETPTYDYAQQATSTPSTTQSQQSSFSSSRQLQNVIQQVQDEQLGDDSSGEGLYDYAQPVEEYDIGAKVQNLVDSINPFADPNVDEFGALREMSPEEKAETISQVPSSSILSWEDYVNQDKITIGNRVTIREDNFEDSVKKVYDTLTSPFEKAGEYVGGYISETIQDFKDNPWTTIGAFGVSTFLKSITNSTPLGMMGSFIFKQLLDDDSSFAQSQIGRSGIVNGTGVPDSDGNYNPQSTSIAGYNSLGMAVDKDGNLVLIDGMYAWDSFGSFMNSFGMSDKEARAITGQSYYYGVDEETTGLLDPNLAGMDVSEEDKMKATQEAMLQATQTESYQGDSFGDMSVDASGNIGSTGMGAMPGDSNLW